MELLKPHRTAFGFHFAHKIILVGVGGLAEEESDSF